jgi:hypothetical protein
MNLQQKLAYAKWVSDNTDKVREWQRGTNDCCTSFLSMHDTVYGTNELEKVFDKYSDTRSAIRFYKQMNLTWRQWLTVNDWTQVETSGTGQEGDIRIIFKKYPTIYMKHNGVWWANIEDRGWTAYENSSWDSVHEYETWRHN